MPSDDDVRQQVAELSARVAFLEAMLQVKRTPDVPAAQAPPPLVREAPVTAAKPDSNRPEVQVVAIRTRNLESRIGAQLLNRIGIVAVLIGVAWFLKLAFDRNWIGPPVRILLGLACAVGLVAWSERFRRRGFAAFSYSLKALGTGIAYLSLWAAFSVFHLAPAGLIFLAMTAVTVGNAVLARTQDSEVLALYALVGGLATPALLSTGHSDEIFLFSYLILLNAGMLLLIATHPWKRLALGALLGTVVYYFGWTVSVAYPANIPLTTFFLAVFFAVFVAVPLLILRKVSSPDAFFSVAFPIGNAAATFLALMVLFGDQHSGRPGVTFALAGACLLMAAASRVHQGLSRTHLGLGIFFVTVVVSLQFHGYVVTLCWLGEALVLVVLAKMRSNPAMRVFATVVLTIAAFSLYMDWFAVPPKPLAVVVNMYFATSLVGAAVFAVVTRLSAGAGTASRGFGGWGYLAGFAAIAFSVTLLVAVCLEVHHYLYCGAGFLHNYCGGFYRQSQDRAFAASFGYSAWFMVYGAGLMTVGFLRRSAFLRWQALFVLAFSVGKVFLSGISQQSQGYRVLSFLALGVLLLAVSFAYQKDWLRLRG
jgi:uncharacterized membrane protein